MDLGRLVPLAIGDHINVELAEGLLEIKDTDRPRVLQ